MAIIEFDVVLSLEMTLEMRKWRTSIKELVKNYPRASDWGPDCELGREGGRVICVVGEEGRERGAEMSN